MEAFQALKISTLEAQYPLVEMLVLVVLSAQTQASGAGAACLVSVEQFCDLM